MLNGIPEILYKYRRWPQNKDVITKHELFFSTMANFNDPFEGKIPIRIDKAQLTPDYVFNKLVEKTKQEHPSYSLTQVHEICFQLQKDGYYNDDHHAKMVSKLITRTLKRNYGILCLSKIRDNYLMWSHYADSHQGFCIGFDSEILYNSLSRLHQIGKVDYQNEIPYYDIFDESIEYIIKILNTKGCDWRYEQEFRIVKAYFVNQIHLFPTVAIKEIILGCEMKMSSRFEIIELVKTHLDHVCVYQAELSKASFKLDVNRIY